MSKAPVRVWSAVLLMSLAVADAGAEQPGGPIVVRLQTGIEVDASGRVVAVEMDPAPTLPGVLQERTRQAIQGWRFKPIMQEGRAVGGKTWANVSLCLVPVEDDGINVAVSLASNGPGEIAGRRERAVPPLPPGIGAIMRDGEELEFESRFRYRVGPDGHAELLEAELLDPDLRRRYGSGWRRVVRQWLSRRRFNPEIVDGQPVATVMEVPITTRLSPFRGVREVEKEMATLNANTDICRAAAGKPDNEAMAIDSRFELLPQG